MTSVESFAVTRNLQRNAFAARDPDQPLPRDGGPYERRFLGFPRCDGAPGDL